MRKVSSGGGGPSPTDKIFFYSSTFNRGDPRKLNFFPEVRVCVGGGGGGGGSSFSRGGGGSPSAFPIKRKCKSLIVLLVCKYINNLFMN